MSKHLDKIKNQFSKNQAGGFGSQQAQDTHSDANLPKNGDLITLTLEQLDYSPLNPRLLDNPKFDDIKESILNTGLQNQLVVTKRPGDDKYTLFNGGNTRLKALREIFSETQDEQFFIQQCTFKTYHSDTEVLINHMIENEERGEMILIDKARAAYRLKELYEQEKEEKLSSRKLSALLKKQGWNCSPNLVAIYIFTVENLVDAIPEFLAAGAGKSKLYKIRTTYNNIAFFMDEIPACVDNITIDKPGALDLYLNELRLLDEPSLDYEPNYAMDPFYKAMAPHLNIEAGRIRAIVEWIRDLSSFPPRDEVLKLINGPAAVNPSEIVKINKLNKQIEKEEQLKKQAEMANNDTGTGINEGGIPTAETGSTIDTETGSTIDQTTETENGDFTNAPENYQDQEIAPVSISDKTETVMNKAQIVIKPFVQKYNVLGKYVTLDPDHILSINTSLPENRQYLVSEQFRHEPITVQYFLLKVMALQIAVVEIHHKTQPIADEFIGLYNETKNIYHNMLSTVYPSMMIQKLNDLRLDEEIYQIDNAFLHIINLYREASKDVGDGHETI